MYTAIWHIFICLGVFYIWDMLFNGCSKLIDIVMTILVLSISHSLSLSFWPNASLIVGIGFSGYGLHNMHPTRLLSWIVWDFRKVIDDTD